RRHVDNTVGVDVERDLDLRHAARRRLNAFEIETAQRAVVRGEFAFALKYMNGYGLLVVGGGREDLALRDGDGCIALDQLCADTAKSFDAERERSDVEEQHVLHLAGEDRALDGRTERNDFVGVYAAVRFLTKQRARDVDNGGHARHATDEDDFVNLVCAQ